MIDPSPFGLSKVKKWGGIALVACFLFFWTTGMLTSLTAAACQKEKYQGQKKLRFCTISMMSGMWLDISTLERSKRSEIRLERGIAFAQLLREQDALDVFKDSLDDVRNKDTHQFIRLMKRMRHEQNPLAQKMWPLALEKSKWSGIAPNITTILEEVH